MSLVASLGNAEADLYRARLLQISGQAEKAGEVYRTLFAREQFRGESALALANLARAAGDIAEARHWLRGASRFGFGDVAEQARLGLAELELASGNTEQAGKELAGMVGGYWAAIGYMNLASAFSVQDSNTSRALVALRVAIAMAKEDSEEKRRQSVLDKLHLQAGFFALQNGEQDKAIDFLEKVSLDGYQTPRALYLHGVALAEKGNYRAAMQSWHRAKKFPLAFAGVPEAWIGMGSGFDLAGYPGQAGEYWLAANAAFESEQATLSELERNIRQHGAYKALVQDARGKGIEWFLEDSLTLTQPRLGYLLLFLEQPDAQAAIRRMARVDALKQTLEQRQNDLEIYTGAMLKHPTGKQVEEVSQQILGLQNQHSQLQSQIEKLLAMGRPGARSDQLKELQEVLASAKARRESLESRSAQYREGRSNQLARVRAFTAENEALRRQLADSRQAAAAALDQQALAFVAQQKNRLARARNRTGQQIAHLYEDLALEHLEGQR